MSKAINSISIVPPPEVSTQIGWDTQVPNKSIKVPLKAFEIDWTICDSDSDSDDEDVVPPVAEVSEPVPQPQRWADYDTEDEDATPFPDNTPAPVVDTSASVVDISASIVDTPAPVVDTNFVTVSHKIKGRDSKFYVIFKSFKGSIDIIHANPGESLPITNLCHTLGEPKQFNDLFGSFFKDETKVNALIKDLNDYLLDIGASPNIKFTFFPEHPRENTYPINSAFIIHDVNVKVVPPYVTAEWKKQKKTGK